MASWAEIEAAAPELAARARERFDAFRHKTLATLRRDGSPRSASSRGNGKGTGDLESLSKAELLARAKREQVAGYSKMTKPELVDALR